MTGAQLYEHLRDDGAGAALGVTLIVVGTTVTLSSLVWLWQRHRARRIRRTPEQQAFVNRLHEAAKDFPADDGLTTDLRRWR